MSGGKEQAEATLKTARSRGGTPRPTKSKADTVPGKIRIRREEGYHTHNIGRCKDRTKFMAFIVGVPTRGKLRADYRKLRWYAVLHRFDLDGKHLDTKALFLGTKAFAYQLNRPEAKLDELIRALGPVTYGDVEIRLFSVRIEDTVFGLVDASVPEERYQRIDLVPNGLAFFPPWDGTYET
jgi:hypothetical protein